MSSEPLLSNVIPFAGSGLLGYAMGFALKKVLKWMLIVVGFIAGIFFVGVQLLQRYGYVSSVNWDKLGNDISTQMQHWAANVDITNVHSLFHSLGIPSGGLAVGFLAGFVRTRWLIAWQNERGRICPKRGTSFYDKQIFYAPAIFILLITSLYYIPINAQGISTSAPNPPTDNSAGLVYLLIFVSVIVVLYKLTHRKRKRH